MLQPLQGGKEQWKASSVPLTKQKAAVGACLLPAYIHCAVSTQELE